MKAKTKSRLQQLRALLADEHDEEKKALIRADILREFPKTKHLKWGNQL